MKLLLVLSLILPILAAKSQNNPSILFTITLRDSTQIVMIKRIGPHVKRVLKNNALNAIIDQFPLKKFEKAYPRFSSQSTS